MITRIFGKPNSGKSLYSLKRLLEYESDICVISLELPVDVVQTRIKTYIENYQIDNNFEISKGTFSNILIKSFANIKLSDLFDFILKVNKEKEINTFLIDPVHVIDYNQKKIKFKKINLILMTFYQDIYNFSKKHNIDIILSDYERNVLSEKQLKVFFENRNLENLKINRNSPSNGVLLESGDKLFTESIKCFFERPLDEVRDEKIDFILK